MKKSVAAIQLPAVNNNWSIGRSQTISHQVSKANQSRQIAWDRVIQPCSEMELCDAFNFIILKNKTNVLVFSCYVSKACKRRVNDNLMVKSYFVGYNEVSYCIVLIFVYGVEFYVIWSNINFFFHVFCPISEALHLMD